MQEKLVGIVPVALCDKRDGEKSVQAGAVQPEKAWTSAGSAPLSGATRQSGTCCAARTASSCSGETWPATQNEQSPLCRSTSIWDDRFPATDRRAGRTALTAAPKRAGSLKCSEAGASRTLSPTCLAKRPSDANNSCVRSTCTKASFFSATRSPSARISSAFETATSANPPSLSATWRQLPKTHLSSRGLFVAD